jgi:ketosteroid isomerase-like protein
MSRFQAIVRHRGDLVMAGNSPQWSDRRRARGVAALTMAGLALLMTPSPSQAQPATAPVQACRSAVVRPAPIALVEEIRRHNAELSTTWLTGDVDRRMAHYAPDSVSNPDYQPRLYGPGSIARYYQALAFRQRVSAHVRRTTEIIPLTDESVLEFGRFDVAYALAEGGTPRSHQGRYANLWRRQADGVLKLKAEVWGYLQRIDDPASYSLGEPGTSGRAAPPGDPTVEAELARLNALDAEAVRTYDAVAKIARYADDAIYMPYADTPKVGIGEIRAHLVRYTEQGRSATFESVRVWNEGFEVLDGYVVEYPKFEVRWRNGADSGIVSGGGLRLWRRQADCSLKMLRQIATHDHRT